jgi:hypothetical protein
MCSRCWGGGHEKAQKTPLTFSSWDDLAPLKNAFDRIMPSAGAPDLAALRLDGDLRNRLRFVVVYPAPDKKHMVTWLTPSDSEKWRHVRALAGDVMEPPVNGYPFVRRVDLDKLYPIPAAPTMTAAHQSDETRAPERRRRPVTTYDWPQRRQSLLQGMLEVILRRSYPQGVPATTATSAVRQKVAFAWKAESQAQGCKPTEPPGWDTINRKLGRSRH